MAVPVRGELAATLSDFAARQQRGVLRPLALGRERLTARAERLPKIEALLQPQAQKLDEQAERLRGALKDRASAGREKLGALRLSPQMLERGLRDGQRALAQVRLAPSLVEQRLAQAAERLAALGRVHASLDPKAPLRRGYALVHDANGRLVRSKAVAGKEQQLSVEFADGALVVVPVGGAIAKAPRKSPPASSGTAQEDLFG
jgi:exodeoxyribonuclease VII large subunit